MSQITQKGATAPLGLFQTSTDSSLETLLGARFELADGREVRLGQAASGTTVAEGKLYQSAALISNHTNIAVAAAAAVGATTVTVTLGATAATANQYAGGFMVVNDVNGEGQTLRIASHPAAGSAASLTLTLEDAVVTALTTSSEVCLIPCEGNAVVICPTASTNTAFGFGMYPIAASAYGLFLVRGVGSALADGTIAVGSPVSPSDNVAGAVEQTPYAANVVTLAVVGRAVNAGVDTEYRAIFATL